jgi:nucleoside-diphosphate-sugar epimerase
VAVKALTENGNNNRHKNKKYLITGPEALSYYQMAELLSNATGKEISYVSISEEEARAAMKEMGMDDWLINTILELSNYFKRGHASQVSSAIQEATGRKPVSFSQFANDYAEAFR